MKRKLFYVGILSLTSLSQFQGQIVLEALEGVRGEAQVWDRVHYIPSFNHSTVNIDGELNNINRLKIEIPYNQATGIYDAVSVTQKNILGRNGNKDLTLYIPQGEFNKAKGYLNAEIIVGNGTTDVYKVKQLEANKEEVITTFSFSINGRVATVTLKVTGGILDRNFDTTIDGVRKHQFIYVPVSVYAGIPDRGSHYERTWLNNNLGADYTNVNKKEVFNPIQGAKSKEDYRAFGSLFQWQRPADGHELVNWTSPTTADLTPLVYGLYNNTDWRPKHSSFIVARDITRSYLSWTTIEVERDKAYHNLWQDRGANNPCPEGYYVPKYGDVDTFNDALYSDVKDGIKDPDMKHFKMSVPSHRSSDYIAKRTDLYNDAFAVSEVGYRDSPKIDYYKVIYSSGNYKTYNMGSGDLGRNAYAIRCVAR